MPRLLFPVLLLSLTVVFLACGAGPSHDRAAAPAADDDASPACVDGERRCVPPAAVEQCAAGRWTGAPPCGRMQYCNFGECVDTLLDLPADELPHWDLFEWWYWTGNLTDADGNLYGFELTFFYAGSLFGIDSWMVNTAVTDERTGRHRRASWFDLHKPEVIGDELRLNSRDAGATGWPDAVYQLSAPAEDASFDLTIVDDKGAAQHGGNGVVRMSSRTTDSFYYSRTRMNVAGSLAFDGRTLDVAGEAWMDHQWGDFMLFVLLGWDWYSLQFSDGTELMYFVFRGSETDPSVIDMAAGTYVDANGNQTLLSQADVQSTPLDHWTSSVTGGVYPQNWHFVAPSLGLDVDIETKVPDQEMPNPMWNYWEGLIHIDGVKGGAPIDGLGYVELSGYAGRPLLWFLFPNEWGE
jgi:predicted secreted hydrolase